MTSADATGLDLDELQREVARFGVAEEQSAGTTSSRTCSRPYRHHAQKA
jgi:hypothetical protein